MFGQLDQAEGTTNVARRCRGTEQRLRALQLALFKSKTSDPQLHPRMTRREQQGAVECAGGLVHPARHLQSTAKRELGLDRLRVQSDGGTQRLNRRVKATKLKQCPTLHQVQAGVGCVARR